MATLGVARALPMLLTASALASGCGAHHAAPAPGARASQVALATFALPPSGIVIWLHPTERPIQLEAVAESPLEVCQVGTTFAGRWRGGCRQLRGGVMRLPSTSGAVHVAFRVRTTSGAETRVKRLDLSWHCVDHFLWLRGHTALQKRARPVFDC